MPEAIIDAIRNLLDALKIVDKAELDVFDPVMSGKYHVKAYKVGSLVRLDIQHGN